MSEQNFNLLENIQFLTKYVCCMFNLFVHYSTEKVNMIVVVKGQVPKNQCMQSEIMRDPNGAMPYLIVLETFNIYSIKKQ